MKKKHFKGQSKKALTKEVIKRIECFNKVDNEVKELERLLEIKRHERQMLKEKVKTVLHWIK